MGHTDKDELGFDGVNDSFETDIAVKKDKIALFAVIYAAAALCVPLCYFDLRLGLSCALLSLALGLVMTKRAVSGTVLTALFALTLIVIPETLLTLGVRTGYLLSFGALAVAIVMGGMSGAFLHTMANPILAPVLSLTAAIGVFAFTSNWELALAALVTLPAAFFLGMATESNERRTTAICYAAGGILMVFAAFLVFYLQKTCGEVNIADVRSLMQSFEENAVRNRIAQRDFTVSEMRALIAQNASTWNAQQMEMAELLISQVMQERSDEALRSITSQYFSLIPGAIALIALIPGYLMQKLLIAGYATSGLDEAITPETEFFTVSLSSSVIFVLSMLLAVTLPEGVAAMTAINLALALTPGFLIYGIGCLRAKLKLLPRGTIKRLWLPIAVLLVCIASSLVLILSLFGAYEKIFGAIRKRFSQNNHQS
jgi:hypothetical protein